MTLDPTLTDGDGIPAPKIDYTVSDNTWAILDHGIARATEVLEAAGAKKCNLVAAATQRRLAPAGHCPHGRRPRPLGGGPLGPRPRRAEPVHHRRQHLHHWRLHQPHHHHTGVGTAHRGLPQGRGFIGHRLTGQFRMQIITERLRLLREFAPEDDWRAVLGYQRDPRYLALLPVVKTAAEEDATGFRWDVPAIGSVKLPRRRYQLAVDPLGAPTPELIGNCGIRLQSGQGHWEADTRLRAELRDHWGQAATPPKPLHAMVQFAFS